jgi:membrane-bound lytic murein transglycosylase MltF
MNQEFGQVRQRMKRSCAIFLFVSFMFLLFLVGCSKKAEPPAGSEPAKPQTTAALPVSSPEEPPAAAGSIDFPKAFGRRTGDLDEMAKNRDIRALVLLSPIGFFYDKGHPQGVMYEAMEEFQKFANQKLKTGKLDIKVTFLPMRADQVEAALNEGVGDIIAYGIVVTPEREQRVAFSTPIQTDVSQIIVTGKNFGAVSSLAELGGKEVYVNPLTTYYGNLQKVNETLQKDGKTPIVIKEADKNLMDDDLVQMVNAGLIPATVTTKQKAALWAQVLTGIQPHPDLAIASGQQLAWVMRKNNPQLKQLVDEFVASHAVGTSFGNTLVRRYLQNTKWVKDSTSSEEMKKFQANLELFQKYSGEYSFDYLMIAAQGYQESLLDQSRRNPSGAVGIMQVIPKYAAAAPISIPNVSTADGNIHAGVKMLRDIDDRYFNDPKIDQLNKTLFVFASYNAGPNRIARLRKEAPDMGLDPNVWFNNVELVAAKDIGQETVTYVSNIYKYYVAYKLAVQQREIRQKAEGLPAK